MKNQYLFDYLAAFVTIVLALALSDILMSLHRLLVARGRVVWNVIPLAATLFVFLSVISEFFSVRIFADVTAVPFFYLVLLVCVSGLMAMAAFTVLPDEVPAAGLSLWDFYLERRAQLWSLIVLAWAGDIARYFSHAHILGDVSRAIAVMTSPSYFVGESGVLVVAVLLAWRKEPWIQGIGMIVLFAVSIANWHNWNIQ
ncbi:MAG TPA: hypothetical protein VLT91_02980 [Rhizomicrobium sp.]|nr:hypothetical protein [Rhizomicrobium sp.]